MAKWEGFSAGYSEALLDKQKMQLNQLAMQKENLSVMQGMVTLAQQQKMLQQMGSNTGEPVTSDTIAANLDKLSVAAVNSGLFDKAEKFANAGSTIRRNQADIEEKHSVERVKKLNVFSSILSDPRFPVNDEASWQRANAAYQMQTGEPSPFAKLPYDPENVGRLQVQIQSAKDQALTAAAISRAKAAEAAVKEREARIPLIKAQTVVAEERAAALAKAGSKLAKIPETQVKVITDLLVNDFGASAEPEVLRVKARPVAERMIELMQTEKIPQTEAAAKAYQEAKQRGDFGGLRPKMSMTGTQQKPAVMPADKGQLKINMYYQGTGKYEGKLLLWTGTGFRLAEPAKSVAAAPDLSAEEDTGTSTDESED
jgi:hypothetical protein